MEEKTEAVKGEETTVGLTMNYNPFSFISCQEDALVLAGSGGCRSYRQRREPMRKENKK